MEKVCRKAKTLFKENLEKKIDTIMDVILIGVLIFIMFCVVVIFHRKSGKILLTKTVEKANLIHEGVDGIIIEIEFQDGTTVKVVKNKSGKWLIFPDLIKVSSEHYQKLEKIYRISKQQQQLLKQQPL